MNKLHFDTQDDELEYVDPQQRRPKPVRAWRRHQPKLSKWEVRASLEERPPAGALPSELTFGAALNVTREERAHLLEQVSPFRKTRHVASILRRVKGGKEANVYCCAAHPETGLEWVAAKVYRPRQFRNLKNDAVYRQGRPILKGDGTPVDSRDWRAKKAVASKSRFGLQLQQTSWSEYEFQTLRRLHAAGADVPRPLTNSEHVLLMEYLGDEVSAAPTLNLVRLEAGEARPLFDRLLRNVAILLKHGLVHGDLSAYNVMYWDGEIRVIDFPQVVEVENNPDAFTIFCRDMTRLCDYFARYGLRRKPDSLARELWGRHLQLGPE